MPSASSHASTQSHPSASVRRAEGYHAWLVLFFSANLATVALLSAGKPFWAGLVFFLPAPWYAWQILHPSSRGLGPVVTKFQTDKKEVWLTIDDGPHPDSTPAMLDLLDAHGAKATFFLIGRKAQKYPELVSEILLHGHTIGNHTHTHPHHTIWYASSRRTAAEIDACSAVLRQSDVETKYFRPPVGIKNHALHRALAQRGFDLVLWSARGFDTISDDPKRTLDRILSKIAPGAIILLHETPTKVDQQREVVSALLRHLARQGYRCVIPPDNALVR